MRLVRSHKNTPEQLDKMRLASSVLAKNLESMDTLCAIETTSKSMNLDNIDRNLLVEVAKRHKKKALS